jgi:L-alanine-DL-glutamate epimerase-like enolase superfamily enzyme
MKITAIRSFVAGDIRDFFFVVVETDEGIRGIGEGGITWRDAAMAGFVEALKPLLIDQDPMRIEHLWQKMFRAGFFPAGRLGAAAVSAIDIALWDIKAKALGVPLYQLLGGRVRDRVLCYCHIGHDDPAGLAAQAVAKVKEGWRFLRFGLCNEGDIFEPTTEVLRAVELFQAAREAVGPEVEIVIDVHTRLDPAHAITLCERLQPLRPFFVEDPIRSENPTTLRKLSRTVNVPIAMGEQWATKWEFRSVIEEELIDYARIDLCIVGGLTEALKIAGWCETHYINIVPHNPLGPVSTAACMHLDLATSNFAVQECTWIPGTYLKDLFPTQVPYEPGYFLLPTQPGLGLELDESALAKYPPLGQKAPLLRRRDGSFTNW